MYSPVRSPIPPLVPRRHRPLSRPRHHLPLPPLCLHHPRSQASRTDARLSTYSGAPSLQPSLAPTLETQTSSNRASVHHRFSQQPYITEESTSAAPYFTMNPAARSSTSTLASTDPKSADLKCWSGTLERMQDERLDKQRYVMSGNKSEEVSKLALGAKVERALARRMTGQDATFTAKKPLTEKASLEVEAN